jgi:hypothetical protein
MIYRLSGRVPEWRLRGSPVRESRPPGFVRGVLSNGHPYRDSDCGEVMCMRAERPKFIWTEGRRCVPVVTEIDVLPAKWRQMGQITECRMVPLVV